jgi:hypothetical protein
MIKTLLLSTILIATPVVAMDNIVTDRPDFTESTDTVPLGWIQVENGYTYTRVDNTSTHSLGEGLIRVGLTPTTELRIGFPNYHVSGVQRGLSDAELGIKWALRHQENAIPATSLILASSFPTGASDFRDDELQFAAKLCMGWDLTPQWAVAANLNYDASGNGEDRFNPLSSSLSFGYSLTDSVGLFAEYYGFYPQEKNGGAAHTLNGGITLLITPDIQMDARVGKTLSDDSWFIGAGTAFRFNAMPSQLQ